MRIAVDKINKMDPADYEEQIWQYQVNHVCTCTLGPAYNELGYWEQSLNHYKHFKASCIRKYFVFNSNLTIPWYTQLQMSRLFPRITV